MMARAITRKTVAVTLPLTVKVDETFVADRYVTGCDKCTCNGKFESKSTEIDDKPNSTLSGIGFSYAMC